MKQLQLPVGADTMGRMAAFIEETLEQAEAPMRAVAKINIAADEVLTNIVTYSGAKTMSVSVDITDSDIHIEFRDDGSPYDPTQRPEPDVTLSAEDREIGGLGIYMVKKMMDQVAYSRDGEDNVLDIFKRIAP